MSMLGDYGKGWVERENLIRVLLESGVVYCMDVIKEMLFDKIKKLSILIMVLFEDGIVMVVCDNDNWKMDFGSFFFICGLYKIIFGFG